MRHKWANTCFRGVETSSKQVCTVCGIQKDNSFIPARYIVDGEVKYTAPKCTTKAIKYIKMKLEKLTPEQETKLNEVRAFWLNYIFSCKNTVDREAAKIGINWLYKTANLNEPVVIYVDSPLACQFAVVYLKEYLKVLGMNNPDQVEAQVGDQVWAQVGDQVMAQVRAQVWAQVEAQVGDQVWDQVGDQVWAQVEAQVGDQVWAQVGDQVRAQVRDQVRDQVGAQVWDQVGDQVWAQVEAQVGAQVMAQVGDQVWAQVGDQVRAQKIPYTPFAGGWYYNGTVTDYSWVSFFDFFTQIGVIDHAGFNQFKNVLLSGIYDMIQLQGFCIVSSLPTKIIRNASGRLHNPTGPAIEFADGYKQYYINGRALPAWIWEYVEQGKITREMFLAEENSEIKGGIYEVMGQKRMMDMLGAEEIDQRTITHRNGDLETVTLLKTKDVFAEIDNQPFAWVKMVCPSTGTQYLQGVEPHHTNALEAIASLSPFRPEEYSFDLRS